MVSPILIRVPPSDPSAPGCGSVYMATLVR
jgi:hypothetical protein